MARSQWTDSGYPHLTGSLGSLAAGGSPRYYPFVTEMIRLWTQTKINKSASIKAKIASNY